MRVKTLVATLASLLLALAIGCTTDRASTPDVKDQVSKALDNAGFKDLKVDVNKESPELEVKVDRVNAGSLGISTGQLGFALRRSVYGQEISTYKEGKDDYNITMRMQERDGDFCNDRYCRSKGSARGAAYGTQRTAGPHRTGLG